VTTSFRVLRRWWPILALLLLSLVVQKTLFESRYDVSGHAAEHLGSSTTIFFATPLVLILLWALGADRLRPLILAGCVVWLVGLIGVFLGNVRVVDAIGSSDWTYQEADRLGAARPGYESGHDLAELSSFVAVAGALLLIAAVWRRRAVSGRISIVSAVLSVLIPPWIFPGAGVVILTFAVVLRRQRELDTAMESGAATAGSRDL
jgi:hypothetical protein